MALTRFTNWPRPDDRSWRLPAIAGDAKAPKIDLALQVASRGFLALTEQSPIGENPFLTSDRHAPCDPALGSDSGGVVPRDRSQSDRSQSDRETLWLSFSSIDSSS